MQLTPLEPWIASKIRNGDKDASGLNRRDLEEYQLRKLRETLAMAAAKSKFYSRHLAGMDLNINSLQEMAGLPFTTADDIRRNPLDFLTVPQGDIRRVVTLQSSGTTGPPKRLFFNASDQELTVDFFRQGMSTFVRPGERVLILLPGKNPGGVGDLLRQALERLGADGLVYGPVLDPAETRAYLEGGQFDCLVGIPVQVLALAKYRDSRNFPAPLKIKSVLLSTDYVPEAVVQILKEEWGCRVYQHYGSTEMGLGGGVECQAHEGCHLREADLYFEIVDPDTGLPVPDGAPGEVVFTTLTRQGMPLIRYRTGDLSRFLTSPCLCGTVLKRLAKVTGRLTGQAELNGGMPLGMPELDEAILPIEGVADFTAQFSRQGKPGLRIRAVPANPERKPDLSRIREALLALPAVSSAVAAGALDILVESGEWGTQPGNAKRNIAVLGEEAVLG